jgi:DNA-binding MarR family transcriptional regulator
MTRIQARVSAREILTLVPLVMRTVAAELRAAGELPAPAHFHLLSMLSHQPRTLSELATLQGVSLPTMSNSISAMVQRGWVTRTAPTRDRRVVIIEVTPNGKSAVERVGRCAETHLADVLAPLDAAARKRLQAGLTVLRSVFTDAPRAR